MVEIRGNMNHRIAVTDGLAKEAILYLKKEEYIVDEVSFTKDEINNGSLLDYDAVIIRSATKLDKKAIEANSGGKLKVICRAGVGVDNIDINAATNNGIMVVNAPSSTTKSVAELTLGHLLSCTRHIPKGDRMMRDGIWAKKELRGSELSGKNLGLIGYGRIARNVSNLAIAFGMNIHAFDPFLPNEMFGEIKKHETIEDLFSSCTHISVHCNLTEDTRGLVGEKLIDLMPKLGADGSNCGRYLVSLSRGGIVNESELFNCLNNGKLTCAGLDVFETEPVLKNDLLNCDNFIGTPHIAASTVEAQIRVGLESAEQIISSLNGKVPANLINKDILD
mgnify:CR=1 FL=1